MKLRGDRGFLSYAWQKSSFLSMNRITSSRTIPKTLKTQYPPHGRREIQTPILIYATHLIRGREVPAKHLISEIADSGKSESNDTSGKSTYSGTENS